MSSYQESISALEQRRQRQSQRQMRSEEEEGGAQEEGGERGGGGESRGGGGESGGGGGGGGRGGESGGGGEGGGGRGWGGCAPACAACDTTACAACGMACGAACAASRCAAHVERLGQTWDALERLRGYHQSLRSSCNAIFDGIDCKVNSVLGGPPPGSSSGNPGLDGQWHGQSQVKSVESQLEVTHLPISEAFLDSCASTLGWQHKSW
eukprot:230297-Rhodomonas_salina.2